MYSTACVKIWQKKFVFYMLRNIFQVSVIIVNHLYNVINKINYIRQCNIQFNDNLSCHVHIPVI